MNPTVPDAQPAHHLLPRSGLDDLIRLLQQDGYQVMGPVQSNSAITLDAIHTSADLPQGWTDEQEPGRYRLKRRQDDALFGYASGPHSLKRLFLPPHVTLWQVKRQDGKLQFLAQEPETPRVALLGARACDLAAIAIQDRVLMHGPHPDPHYAARRRNVLVIAVQCATPGGTCFCASMGTGPGVTAGYDLALTELMDGGRHRFVVQTGSETGASLVQRLSLDVAGTTDMQLATRVVEQATQSMGRTLTTQDLPTILKQHPEHPRWDQVAQRCLACTNCTLVCPTCFCTNVAHTTDLTGEQAIHTRQWDSCFTLPFSYIHGGSVRTSIRGRYRQWLTHKLSTWWDQFGTTGCVGCGRCITWCPVGIDITEEATAIRSASDDAKAH